MTILVGVSPAASNGCMEAFAPASQSGARLARLLGVQDIRQVVRTVNLYDMAVLADGASAQTDKLEAELLLRTDIQQGENIICAGTRVVRAFRDTTGHTLYSIPHPSGLNRAWNNGGVEGIARQALRGAIGPRYKLIAQEQGFRQKHTAYMGWDYMEMAAKAIRLMRHYQGRYTLTPYSRIGSVVDRKSMLAWHPGSVFDLVSAEHQEPRYWFPRDVEDWATNLCPHTTQVTDELTTYCRRARDHEGEHAA